MDRNQLSDSVFDALFERAVIDNFYEEYNALPSLEELSEEYTFSEKHEKRMKALFAQEERKARLKKIVHIGRRVAAVLIVIVSILFGSLMLVSEVRAVVVGTVIEWFDQFARFTSRPTEAEKADFEPTYIPDGFREYYRYSDEFVTIILFVNASGIEIIFEASLTSAQLSVSNEGYDYEVKRLESIDYHLFTAIIEDKVNFIVWESEGQRYLISSLISIDELLKMALSVG